MILWVSRGKYESDHYEIVREEWGDPVVSKPKVMWSIYKKGKCTRQGASPRLKRAKELVEKLEAVNP